MKRKNYCYISAWVLFLFLCTSCEKLFIEPDPKNTPQECFESLWTRIDEKYSFLSYKKINWDSVKAVYQPQIKPNMSDGQLFRVFDSMLYTLRDGHVNLIAPFNTTRNWEWFLGYPQNFNRTVMERNYWKNDYFITGPFVNKGFEYNGKKIGYFYYGSFSSDFSDYHLSFVIDRFRNSDGLIIDLRDNGGGTTTNIFKLVNRFVSEKKLVGFDYEKSGKGHDEFTMSQELYAKPAVDDKDKPLLLYVNKPIVLLTNRSCYSACNMFIGFMSTLPNVTILGDQSGGGGGLPTSYQLPNGWIYRFSSTFTSLPDGLNLEGGVPVDIRQDMSPANEINGIDDIMEKAFQQF